MYMVTDVVDICSSVHETPEALLNFLTLVI